MNMCMSVCVCVDIYARSQCAFTCVWSLLDYVTG